MSVRHVGGLTFAWVCVCACTNRWTCARIAVVPGGNLFESARKLKSRRCLAARPKALIERINSTEKNGRGVESRRETTTRTPGLRLPGSSRDDLFLTSDWDVLPVRIAGLFYSFRHRRKGLFCRFRVHLLSSHHYLEFFEKRMCSWFFYRKISVKKRSDEIINVRLLLIFDSAYIIIYITYCRDLFIISSHE